MKTVILMVLFAIAPIAFCQSPTCPGRPLQSESDVLNILRSSTPLSRSPETRHCIAAAIDYAGELRSKAAIQQLVRYLFFQKESPTEKHPTFQWHSPIEGEDYPAVLALAEIGAPARPVLLKVIESESASLLERQNAAHAIVMSFLSGPKSNPGKGILYLRQAKRNKSPVIAIRIDQMIHYTLTTRACTRFAPKCSVAARQTLPKTLK